VASERPRNPFRNEADAFRVLMMFVAAGAAVIAVALLVDPLAGALLGVALVAVGLWRAWGLWQSWRETGSAPR
jgi:hypothetical protein